MPQKPRPGTRALYVELPASLDAELRTYCEKNGLTLADEVRLALRRHLANPPELSPLPPMPGAKPKRPGRPKKGA